MFGFLKKAVSGLVDGIKKKVEESGPQDRTENAKEATTKEEDEAAFRDVDDIFAETPTTAGKEVPTEQRVRREKSPFEHEPLPSPAAHPGPGSRIHEKLSDKVKTAVEKTAGRVKGIRATVAAKERAITEKATDAVKGVRRIVEEKEIKESEVSELFWNFQLQLIAANVAQHVAEKICDDVKKSVVGKRVKRSGQGAGRMALASLKKFLLEIVGQETPDIVQMVKQKKGPFLALFLGFNGSGKTTTLARFGRLLQKNGLRCVFAAGDSFRAAAIEQLEEHGKRLGINVIKHQYGSDAAAVIFDAMRYAEAHAIDVVLADTAGRQHTNVNLMNELQKICKVNKPDMKVLVLDALSGSDICNQSETFDKAVGIDALVITKADVDEKGGAIISAAYAVKKPILFLGLGQGYDDLKRFDAEEYVNGLFST